MLIELHTNFAIYIAANGHAVHSACHAWRIPSDLISVDVIRGRPIYAAMSLTRTEHLPRTATPEPRVDHADRNTLKAN